METVKTQCPACKGTGLYRGFAEPPGVAVICLECEGSGCKVISYIPFVQRQERGNIQKVCRSRGSFIGTGVGPTEDSITYGEFLAGKMP